MGGCNKKGKEKKSNVGVLFMCILLRQLLYLFQILEEGTIKEREQQGN
jgi:hypothetical protein